MFFHYRHIPISVFFHVFMRSLLVRVGVKALYHTITYFGLL